VAKAAGRKKRASIPANVTPILALLAERYGQAECALHHANAFQLLIATILSAQCTDERVNIVTKELFAKYPTAHDLATAPLQQVEKLVQSTGFFRAKAKNIVACASALVQNHAGEVPQNLADLVLLSGVGRKTANVVLGTVYGIPSGVVVDTHVTRISQRLGFTHNTNAVKIEQELMRFLPQNEWILFSHRVIHHGRQICKARKPLCSQCLLRPFCPQTGVETSA
jgi:endonuclease III